MTSSAQGGYRTRPFGKYTLLERIGAGGMAEIYRAKVYGQHGFEKEVAIKKILPNLTDDAEFIEMFINEAKIMVGLVHSNIVQVFDLGELDRQFFIAMEYVHGKDLLDLLARCAEVQLKVPLKLAIFLVMEMLKGLEYAHSAADYYGNPLGIIHRDVSPSNVLLSYSGDVKVGDFGVAKAATQRSRTEIGTLKGKVGYMSPEQVRGDSIDHRSDLFAAGIILFELLNMRRLFIGGSDLDVMLRVRDVDIDAELKNSIALPDDLRAIVVKSLAREVGDRYQTAGELHDDLMDFLFRHQIRVHASDLSRFLSKVFEKDIEQDKLKRLHFRDKEDELRRAADERHRQAHQPRSAAALLEGPPPESRSHDDLKYRFRDATGLVFGPMSIQTLTNLLVGTPLDAQPRVSIDGEEWVPLEALSEIHRAVLEAKEAAGNDLSDVPHLSDSASSSSSDEPAPPRKTREAVSAGEPQPTVAPSATVAETETETEPEPEPEPEPELIDPPIDPEGSLDDMSFARLVFRIWAAKADGCLTIQSGAAFKKIFFERGNPSSVVSNNDAELLGNFLVREGILSQPQLERALERASVFGGRLGDALVADRVLQSHVLFEYLFRQARLKLFDIFTWRKGDYTFSVVGKDDRSYPLGIDSLEILLEGVKRYVSRDFLADHFRDRQYVPLKPLDEPPVRLDDLRLSAKQLRIASAATTPPVNIDSLDRQLTAGSKIDLEDVHRVVYLLMQMEALAFAY